MTLPAIMNTYGRLPITFTHGKGVYLYDTEGNEYLDAISGIGVNALGHAFPALTKAVSEQAGQLIHTSNLYGIERQQKLAESLCAISGMDNVFFGNSGAEANEAAIKIARLYGHNKDIKTPHIIVMEGAFHGRTMATITASGNRKVQAGFEPLLGGFIRAPFGDFSALEAIAAKNKDVVAVLIEPIQGEGGLHPLPAGFLKQLRALCDQNEWLMMLDEVQTGNGRTGKYFAYQHEGILPDVVATAKGLGNGMPIGACLARGDAANVLVPGTHGSTYGGNPIVCAAAQVVVDTVTNDKLCDNATNMGAFIADNLRTAFADNPLVKEVRGKGLMIGIELNQPCAELVNVARAKGVLINVTSGSVIRLLPPLIINQQQAQTIIDTIINIVEQLD
jgi:acetylornithine aminotransferase